MTDSQNPQPVSLAELRKAHSFIWREDIPHVPCMDPSCSKTRAEHAKPLRDIYDALPALLDLAEAAQALDKRNTSHDLDEALAKVRA